MDPRSVTRPTQGVNTVIGETVVAGHVLILNARALVWAEEKLGMSTQAIVMRITIAQAGARECSVLLWAGIEAARRRRGDPGPEFTMDEALDLVDEYGLIPLQMEIAEAITRSVAIRVPKSEEVPDGEADPPEATSSTGPSSSPEQPEPAYSASASGT